MATKRATATASEIDLSRDAMLARFNQIRHLAFPQYWDEVEEAHRAVLNSPERKDQLAQRTGRAAFALRLFTEPALQPLAIAAFERLQLAVTFEQAAEGLLAFEDVKGGEAGGRLSDRARALEFVHDMFRVATSAAHDGSSADPVLNVVLGVEGFLFGVEERRPSRADFRRFESDAQRARQGAYLDLVERYDPKDLLIALLCLIVALIGEERGKNSLTPFSPWDRYAMLVAESWFRLTRGRSRGVRPTEELLSTATLNECFAIQAILSTWEPTLTDDEVKTAAGKWLRKHKRAVDLSREKHAEAKLQQQEANLQQKEAKAASRVKGAVAAKRQPRKVLNEEEKAEAAAAEAKLLERAVNSDELLTKVTRLLLCLDGAPGRPRKTPTDAESQRFALIRDVESGIFPAAAEP